MRTDQMSRRFSSFGHPVPLALAIVLMAMCSGCAGGMAASGGSSDPLVGTWSLVSIMKADGVTPLSVVPTSGWYWTVTMNANRSYSMATNVLLLDEPVEGILHLALGPEQSLSGAWTAYGGRIYVTTAGSDGGSSSNRYDIAPGGNLLRMWAGETDMSNCFAFARVR
jgi:hypothetical protein